MKLSFSLLMLLICIVYIYGLSPLEKLRAMNKEIDSYDILFSIGLVNSEMNKPNQDNNGTYKYNATEEAQLTDIFEIEYNNDKVKETQTETINQLVSNYLSRYKEYLTKNDKVSINQKISFISVKTDDSISFMKELINKIMKELSEKTIINTITQIDFDRDSFINNELIYNPTESMPKLSILDNSYRILKFGFDISQDCNKYKNRIKNNRNIAKILPSSDIVDTLYDTFFKDESKHLFYSVKDPLSPVYNFSKSELQSNITLLKAISDNYLFNYINDNTFNPSLYSTVHEIYNTITYEHLLSSDLHNYLQLSPFFYLLIDLFNHQIGLSLKEITDDSKRLSVIFGVHDIVLAGLYRLFAYNGYSSVYQDELVCQGQIEDIQKCPFIEYGSSIFFDLIKGSDGNHYIMMYDRLSSRFTVSISDFTKVMKDILVYPDFNEDFRKNNCN